jgi:hypothetical protein
MSERTELQERLKKYEAVTEGLKRQWPNWQRTAGRSMAIREAFANEMRRQLNETKG